MKQLVSLALISILASVSFSQNTKIDPYQIEEQGYFTHPAITSQGIVLSDNFASKIYLIKNGELEELVAAPGCGRFYTVSPGKSKIGFKLIKPDGMQVPAILNISTKEITELHEPVELCGQVSFSNNGKTAYTIGDILYVKNDTNIQTFDLDIYANIVPVSPDGNYAVFNDNNDQLHIIDLTSGKTEQITGNETGFVYPQWSPDGSKLIFSTLSGELVVWDRINAHTYPIGQGGNAGWSEDSQYIIYQRTIAEDFQLKSSDIFISKYDASQTINLTQTPGIYEMNPIFGSNNNIIYHTYNKREIISAAFINSQKSSLTNKQIILKKKQKLPIKFYNTSKFIQDSKKSIVHIPGDAPYISQLYDTPDFHTGNGSCAPSTAVMALGYYNRLPKWETPISSPYSHTNDYGSYVADKYRFNEIYYDTYTSPYGSDSWGGYSYMWYDGSPNSKMKSYLQNHWLTSNQLWTSSCTYEYTTDEIDLGYPHPICSWISTAGHLTLTVGYVVGQHTLIFNDPYGNKNTSPWSNYTPTDKGINVYYDWPGYNNGYANLDADGSHGGVAWTVRARSSEPVYNDTIIDDIYYDHGFYMYNQSPSHMRYFRDQNAGYNGHFWWTITMDSGPDYCWVTWTPNLPEQGEYKVFVYIPSVSATATIAKYNIYYDGGDTTVIINQSIYFDQWISLGTYQFAQGQSGYVYLGDFTGIDGQAIAFDAVKWEKVPSPLLITSTNVTCYGDADGTAAATPTNGIPPYTYEWSDGQTNDTATGLSGGTYYVTVTDDDSNTYTGTAIITEPALLEVNAAGIAPSFSGADDGEIITGVTGGTAPYVFVWNPVVSTSSSADSLTSGIYIITVNDVNGCIAIDTVILIDPACEIPDGLSETLITHSSATLSWLEINYALGFYVRVQENGASSWDYYFTSSNYYVVTGLAANTLHDWEVAAICYDDTSDYISSAFTTTGISDQTITACKGKFTDSGGENAEHGNNEYYIFTISPLGASKISITFSEFELESGYDSLWVYDGTSTSAAKIGAYSGTTGPGTIVSGSGSLTFEFYSDNLTTMSGWVARWTSYSGSCGNLPETYIDTLIDNWQTTDFNTYFIDIDNSTYGLQQSFYQVNDYNGTEWRANQNNGFLNDNFNTAIHPDWVNISGNWSINSGSLQQTNEDSSNTNIYIPLAQDSLSVYLYQWKMKIDGTGADRRAGIHFFCDDASLTNRGNSYMAYFRVDDNKVQIYKCIDDIFYTKTNDAHPIAPNTWYDYKIVFEPSTGKITAYIDDILVSVWTDSLPHTSGNYLSLRTGNSNVMYDDFRVFKSRNNSAFVTAGSAPTNDVRYQNINPLTPSSRINSIVQDKLEHFSAPDTLDINIDWTPPAAIVAVNDGPGVDIDTTNSANELSANWSSSNDTQSDILKYWYSIGTSPGATDLTDWTDNGTDISITESNFLFLTNGSTYYFSVKAENYAGLFSNITTSDGQLAILAPTPVFDALNTTICEGDTVLFINNTLNATDYEWNFEGGTPSASILTGPTVTYTTAGTYTVTLIATGAGGTDTLVLNNFITVNNVPVADFYVSDTLLYLPDTIVTFTNSSTYTDAYFWDFGDSSTSTDENPYHIYSDTGEYTITLVAISNNCDNDTLILTGYIHIIDASVEDINNNENYFNVYPNPFTDNITISYSIAQAGQAEITIYDLIAKNTVTILNEEQTQGEYIIELSLNKLGLAQGAYVIMFRTENQIVHRKLVGF